MRDQKVRYLKSHRVTIVDVGSEKASTANGDQRRPIDVRVVKVGPAGVRSIVGSRRSLLELNLNLRGDQIDQRFSNSTRVRELEDG